MIPHIKISEYTYELPEERIAKYPLERRDASKLLVFKDNTISDKAFTQLPEQIPSDAMMVFNETKVVPARLHFRRESGAHIEIFCLEPVSPADYVLNFAAKSECSWKCIVGNVKKWRGIGELLLMNPNYNEEVANLNLRASMVERNGETSVIKFSWQGNHEFSEVLDICGTIPIPPYLNRDSQEIDIERYQTTYAMQRGSVAAPTAGLHFTPEVIDALQKKGVNIRKVCLHVGAGTFLPVKSEEISGHRMHREPFVVRTEFLKSLSDHKKAGKTLVAVGTTSVRTLESLYWAGVRCLKGKELSDIEQWEPYEEDVVTPSAGEAVDALVSYAESHGMKEISLGTSIIIVPGYRPRITDALVTNFHQPQSTLLLLISSFIGEKWREIYSHALENSYRFLSYGDSSLLWLVR